MNMTRVERIVLWVVVATLIIAFFVGVVWPAIMLAFSHHASG